MTSLTQFSNPPRFPLATQNLPVRVETVETVEKPQLEARRENAAGDGAKGQYRISVTIWRNVSQVTFDPFNSCNFSFAIETLLCQ